MLAIKQGNTVVIGNDFVDCLDNTQTGWKFFMMPGVDAEIKVMGERTMDEAEKVVITALAMEGIKLRGYAAVRL